MIVRTFAIIIYLSFIINAYATNDLAASTRVSSQGILLQSERLKIIAQNIANAGTSASTSTSEPYSRKILQVKLINNERLNSELTYVNKISKDKSDFILRYEPHHPAADVNGNVKYPNVDPVLEMADAKEAQRSFEANLSALEIARSNQMKILEALK